MVLDLILIGLVIGLEPIPLTAYLLLLSAEGGPRKGLGYLVGWILTIVVLVVLTLVVTGGKAPRTSTAPGEGVLIAKLVVGLGLIFWAWHIRRRPKKPKSPPAWVSKIDRLSFGGSMLIGFLVQPWPLVIAGVATVSEANLSQGASYVWLTVFCLLASAPYLIIQAQVIRSPDVVEKRLKALMAWIEDHRDIILVYVSGLLGIWLVVHSALLLA